jgi:hypothetical protein
MPVSLSAQAISDTGPGKFERSSGGALQSGFGAELRLSIPLGGGKEARPGTMLPRFELNAGPTLLFGDSLNGRAAGQQLRAQGGLMSLRLTPSHSTKLQLAGQNVAATYGPLAADEEREERKGSLGSDIAWVALVAGGVMATLIGVYAISCGPSENDSCGSA